ncbi:unnamed protein product [Phytomonas sp. EM1]|nr:unnamed protein product [Phytomonas sp. EM1]|eukprot:CCW62959.1 unnamed protein product [Phytomonas sp. isolate EM1]
MALDPFRIRKPKTTLSSVQGKITVLSADGERIGQWGGTECFLSRQAGLGPCLVVRSSRHRRGQGTFFQLSGLRQVLSSHVLQGKLTLVLPHAHQRLCTVFINASPTDIEELQMMAGTLQDRSRWGTLEKNVAKHAGGSAARGRGSGQGREAGASGDKTHTRSGYLRDPTQTGLEREYNDSTDDEDEYSSEAKAPMPSMKRSRSLTDSPRPPDPCSAPEQKCPPYKKLSSDAFEWTPRQAEAVVLLRDGRNVFVTGAAGTGKTAWLQRVIRDVLPQERTVVTAATGVAARALGGFTIHSFAGIGRGEGALDSVLRKVKSKPSAIRCWQACDVLVLDEIGMLPAHVFSLLDAVARDVRQEPNKPFGGIQLLVVTDFLQLSPVARAGEEVQSVFASVAWQQCNFHGIQFTENYRHASDARFARCCEDVRSGRYTLAVDNVLSECLNRDIGKCHGVEAVVILPQKKDVDHYNQLRLDALGSAHAYRYTSEDYAMVPGSDISSEIPLPALLNLKIGAQVMLLSTLPEHPSLDIGRCGVVRCFVEQSAGEPALPVVEFIIPGRSVEVLVPWITMEVMNPDGSLSMVRRQVPLELAWALTIHRVQGITLPMVKVPLDSNFSEPGQPYTAISRVESATNLCITALDPKIIANSKPEVMVFYEKIFPTDAEEVIRYKAQMEKDRGTLEARLAQRQPPQSRWRPYLEGARQNKSTKDKFIDGTDRFPHDNHQPVEPLGKKMRHEKDARTEGSPYQAEMERDLNFLAVARDNLDGMGVNQVHGIAPNAKTFLRGKGLRVEHGPSTSPAATVVDDKQNTEGKVYCLMKEKVEMGNELSIQDCTARGLIVSNELPQLTQESEALTATQGTQTLEIMRKLLVENDE